MARLQQVILSLSLISGLMLSVRALPALTVLNTTGNLTMTHLADQYLVLVNATSPATAPNVTSVPAWERLDAPLPHPTLLLADDFAVPAAIVNCSEIVVDVPLLLSMASGEEGYRAPTLATFYLFPRDGVALNTTFNASKSIALRAFTAPSEGNWSVPGASGGITVDEGGPRRMHIETFRFRLSDVAIVGGQTYWLAMCIAQERAFNASDYSQNQPRWLTAVGARSGGEYRVVDRAGNYFPLLPSLNHWSNASAVEKSILPFWPSGLEVAASETQQLAFTLTVSNCFNMTPFDTHSTPLIAALPAQETPFVFMTPSPTPTPMPTPTPTPTPEPTPTPPAPGTATTTPPLPVPLPPSPSPSPTPTPPPPPQQQQQQQPSKAGTMDTEHIVVYVVCILVLIILVLIVLYVVARRLQPHYTNMKYDELLAAQQHDEELENAALHGDMHRAGGDDENTSADVELEVMSSNDDDDDDDDESSGGGPDDGTLALPRRAIGAEIEQDEDDRLTMTKVDL